MTRMENFPQTKADRDLLADGVKVSIFGRDSCWDRHLKLWIEAFQCHKQNLNRMLDLFTNAPQYLPRPINGQRIGKPSHLLWQRLRAVSGRIGGFALLDMRYARSGSSAAFVAETALGRILL